MSASLTCNGQTITPTNRHDKGILACASVVLLFAVSGNLLNASGIPYEADGGFPAEKIHPGSYLAILSGLLKLHRLHAARRPLSAAQFDLLISLAALALCILFATCMSGLSNLIALLDTFLPAIMLALAVSGAPGGVRSRLRFLLRAALALNAVIAIGEATSGENLISAPDAESDRAEEFRPDAFYDHPLTGASATLLMFGCMPRGVAGRAYAALACLALAAFGERIPLACAALLLAQRIFASTTARPGAIRRAPFAAPGAVVATIAIAAAAASAGVGQRLITHLYWDSSADARLFNLSVFGQLTWPQLLLGCPRRELIALLEPMRLQSGAGVIENFWLLMAATLGVFGLPIFLISLAALLRALWRDAAPGTRALLLAVLATASTSNSLGRKSALLIWLVAAMLSSPQRENT